MIPRGCIAGDLAGCGTTQQGLNQAQRVAVSPDGRFTDAAGNEGKARRKVKLEGKRR